MIISVAVRSIRALASPNSNHITRTALASVALIAAMLLASVSSAQTALTLEEAQHIAVQRSRQLTAQEASVTAAREMAVAAGQLPDPTLRFGLDSLPVTSSPG